MIRRRASALLLLASGCASQVDLAREIETATREQNMPKVVACWERQFEAAGFHGSYLATVDLRLEDGEVTEVSLRELSDTTHGEPAEPGPRGRALGSCVVEALSGTTLPGLDGDVSVTGLRMAFVDATADARAAARQTGGSVLIGPRADRCQGLYIYDPPRGAQELAEELARAQAAAAQADPDERVRQLQRAYDVGLELRARLTAETERADLPEASRTRFEAEIDRVTSQLNDLGEAIGCDPP